MTKAERGDVVLVGFVFSDESGRKLRPAVVMSGTGYNRSRHEVIVAAITSNTARRLYGDWPISQWKSAGLLFPSICTGIVRTIKKVLIERKLGAMAVADVATLDREIRRSLEL